jgi:hypothetical protein
MPIIYVATPDGAQATYEDSQLQRLWQQGAIHPESLYWREGMAGWQPLKELWPLPAPGLVAYGAPPAGTVSHRPAAQPLASLGSILGGLLWANLAFEILGVILSASGVIDPGSPTATSIGPREIFQGLLGLLAGGVYIATVVIWMVWIHRANSNCRALGAQGMRFTPGWAVGYHFIPFVNLVMPYNAMAEIWRASANPAG